MNKYILAAALIFASAGAMADRMVSAAGNGSTTKAAACESAKSHTILKKNYDEKVVRYSTCDCTNDGKTDTPWSCSVDAELAKKGKD